MRGSSLSLVGFLFAFALVCYVGMSSAVHASPPALGEEFVGPFENWVNVKTDYGAVGDGVTDDTTAFQNALNDLATDGHSASLYIPAGTYKITDTLHYTPRQFSNFIGEDPDTTILQWAGGSTGPLLWVDGVNYSRFSRLTFDGAGEQIVLVEQGGYDNNFFFDTGNEYADNIFRDADIGIRCGYGTAESGSAVNGCSEMSVLRSHFLDLRLIGIMTGNFNALDIWVWNSVFDTVGTGVGNQAYDPATEQASQATSTVPIDRNVLVATLWAKLAIILAQIADIIAGQHGLN